MSFRIWLVGLVSCTAIALCAVPAPAQNVGSCDRFIANLEHDDFIVSEGVSIHFDPIGKYCAGIFPNALYANYGAPYASGEIPPSPRVPPGVAVESDPEGLPIFRLDPDEAVVLVGLTPPPETYFSYQIYLASRQFRGSTAQELILNSLGDTVNIHTINTIGSDPFERPMVMIFTPDQGIEARIRAALRRAGFPTSVINTIVIPSATVKLGQSTDSDTFLIANRNAIFVAPAAGAAYVAHPTFRVLRLTPEEQPVLDPFPTPPLRVRGTGQTEIDLTPTVAHVRQAVLDFYAADHTATEYVTAPTGTKGSTSPSVSC